MAEARDIILGPIVTEKTNAAMEHGKYAFWVAMDANRTEIKKAIEEIFKVHVKDVNTLRQLGKVKRMGIHSGMTQTRKKAVVTLEEGQRIQFFEAV
ncbi:MAG TPA: 50S ribosomal protein L23 [Bacillota bacterium]|jgi:large subunit ribosomal protein L23